MTLKQITAAIYALYLTNKFGYKLKYSPLAEDKKALRIEYAEALFGFLKIEVKLIGQEKLPQNGQYLLISNHRTIIDSMLIEIASKGSPIFGHWIAKKELHKSPFFGAFVRNGGSVLLDRDSKNMSGFFKQIKSDIKKGVSIFVFPKEHETKQVQN